MKLISNSPMRQNGTKVRHQLAVSRRSRSLSPPKLPQPLPQPSTGAPLWISQDTMSSSNDLVPPSGLHRLPHPPTMPCPVPPLPAAWIGKEEMKVWLNAKMEEDRRKQEEERSYQANVLLEQRRIEQAVIADTLRAGVPPTLIPLIFHGIYTTGANLKLAAELQRQWSTPARPVPAPQHSCAVPAQHVNIPHPTQPSQSTPLQPPQQPHQVLSSESWPMATSYLPGMSQHPSTAAKSKLHRSRSRSDRQKLERELKPPMTQSANQDSLNPGFNPEPFPARSGPTQTPPTLTGEATIWTSGIPSQSPLEYHHWSPPELDRPQSRLQSPPPLLTFNHAASNAPQLRAEQMNPPSSKRKDERPHEKVPPPRSRRNESVSSRRNSYGESQPEPNQQSDISSPNDSRAYEADCSEQPSDSTRASVERPSLTPSQGIRKRKNRFQSSANSVDAPEPAQDAVDNTK
ncbi:hypothetical protein N7457_008814 [Penicillium paradoxum]|uniref:uncharacterized protein n=1 Tax=Penicillium paradoxum TaxID=176176 RepID=UPI002547791E|nr:uncharacterized protein N7457_008814 [Penicillium paradoxum]KAJ5773918.1 hypothetical protein N7457_008814 [Penicillium paradoxum]